MDFANKHVHLMGIGGCGVSALVPLLQQRGAFCSGCDLAQNKQVQRLQEHGVAVEHGHDPAHLSADKPVDILVYSTAVSPDHEEIRHALEQNIPVLSRAACLAELMRGHKTVAVAGSHGKSTTTWFLAHALLAAGHDPLVMLGGTVPEMNTSGGRAGEDLFIAEVDESDGGFLHVEPHICVLTNIDHEHLEYYEDFSGLCRSFANWLARLPVEGLVLCDSNTLPKEFRDLAMKNLPCPMVSFGLSGNEDYTAENIRYSAQQTEMDVIERGSNIGRVTIPIPGEHNIRNVLAAIATLRSLDPEAGIMSLASCHRVAKRFNEFDALAGVRIIEDYAHHPTEVRAVIQAARIGSERVHVLMQPHRYTRTKNCFADFVTCFDQAESVSLLPIYAASEKALPGINSQALSEAINNHRDNHNCAAVKRESEAAAWIGSHCQEGDAVLILGASNLDPAIKAMREELAR